jgi:hypothetical protein
VASLAADVHVENALFLLLTPQARTTFWRALNERGPQILSARLRIGESVYG